MFRNWVSSLNCFSHCTHPSQDVLLLLDSNACNTIRRKEIIFPVFQNFTRAPYITSIWLGTPNFWLLPICEALTYQLLTKHILSTPAIEGLFCCGAKSLINQIKAD